MKNYFKANTFRAPVLSTIVTFDDADPASVDRAWSAVCEIASALAYRIEGRPVLPAIVVWRRPATPGPWSALGQVSR